MLFAVTLSTAQTTAYCVLPARNCSDSDDITNVKILNDNAPILDNNSGCSTGGFSLTDVSSSVNLLAGSTYTLSVSKRTRYSHGCTAWIDFNRNGVFDSSEMIFQKAIGKWSVETESFTVPTSIVQGTTRIRINLSFQRVPPDPCTNSIMFGETEDYVITLGSLSLPCATNATINGTITTEKLASQSITSTGTTLIPAGANVHIGANKQVVLNPGFSTVNSAVLLVDTNGCTN